MPPKYGAGIARVVLQSGGPDFKAFTIATVFLVFWLAKTGVDGLDDGLIGLSSTREA